MEQMKLFASQEVTVQEATPSDSLPLTPEDVVKKNWKYGGLVAFNVPISIATRTAYVVLLDENHNPIYKFKYLSNEHQKK